MAKNTKQQAAIAMAMKAAGKKPRKKMKAGGTPDPDPTDSKKRTIQNLVGFGAGGLGTLLGTIFSNSDAAAERAEKRYDKRRKRQSDRREKRGFQPYSTPSFGKYKNGGTLKTKKK